MYKAMTFTSVTSVIDDISSIGTSIDRQNDHSVGFEMFTMHTRILILVTIDRFIPFTAI